MAQTADDPHSLDYHLRELRQRLKYSSLVFVLFAIGGFVVSGRVLAWLQQDLSLALHALVPYEALYTQVLIAVLVGFVASLPVVLYELLQFAKPGLKPGEYRLLRNYLPFAMLLFLLGAGFAYQFIVKAALQFFQQTTTATGVAAVWGLRSTISFVLRLSTLTGIVFQLPIVAVVLAKAGLLHSHVMRQYRGHFIVAILVVAAVATLPDVLTQLLIVVPVLGLYQLSIWLVARIEPMQQ